MYLRIIKASLKPGQGEELARQWEAFQKPRLQALPGFCHAHLGGDREGNQVQAVTIEEYEVLAEV